MLSNLVSFLLSLSLELGHLPGNHVCMYERDELTDECCSEGVGRQAADKWLTSKPALESCPPGYCKIFGT